MIFVNVSTKEEFFVHVHVFSDGFKSGDRGAQHTIWAPSVASFICKLCQL
jgi:hypothetical protein